MVEFGQSGSIRAKIAVIGQKWLYSGKSGFFSGKSGSNREKKRLY